MRYLFASRSDPGPQRCALRAIIQNRQRQLVLLIVGLVEFEPAFFIIPNIGTLSEVLHLVLVFLLPVAMKPRQVFYVGDLFRDNFPGEVYRFVAVAVENYVVG